MKNNESSSGADGDECGDRCVQGREQQAACQWGSVVCATCGAQHQTSPRAAGAFAQALATTDPDAVVAGVRVAIQHIERDAAEWQHERIAAAQAVVTAAQAALAAALQAAPVAAPVVAPVVAPAVAHAGPPPPAPAAGSRPAADVGAS